MNGFDPNKIAVFGGSSHPELTKAICTHLGIPVGQLKSMQFGNGQWFVQFLDNVRNRHLFLVQTSTTSINNDIMELFLMIDAAHRASVREITVINPYFFYARSEKKNQPRIAIAGSMVAGLMESLGVDRVVTFDLHNPAIQGFFRRTPCDELFGSVLFNPALRQDGINLENCTLVASDAGAEKNLGGRYGTAFPGLPQATIQKHRIGNTDTVKIIGLAGDVCGKICLLYDDESATAGTLIEGSDYLVIEKGAEAVLSFITHGVLIGNGPEKIAAAPRIKMMYALDTVHISDDKIARSGGKIRVVSCAELIAKAIKSIVSNDGSIQDLLYHEAA